MNIRAKKIRIEFNNPLGDYWEAPCGSGLEFDEAIRMITRAWEEHDAPAEPLIKDEKIRKAVRAWAEACGAKQIKYSIAPNQYYDADMGTGFSIKFMTKPVEVYLEEGKMYTIAELCGEEEAPEPIEPTFIDLDERVKEKEEE